VTVSDCILLPFWGVRTATLTFQLELWQY